MALHLRSSGPWCALWLAAAFSAPADESIGTSGLVRSEPGGRKSYHFAPARRIPETLEPYLRHVAPGGDAFPQEKEALELSVRLKAFGDRLRAGGPAKIAEALEPLLAADFKGGSLLPAGESGGGPFEVFRGEAAAGEPLHDRKFFVERLQKLLEGFDTLHVTELLITAIDAPAEPDAHVTTVVRYDIVGSGKGTWRGERIGHWRLRWRRETVDVWNVTEWQTIDTLRSTTPSPVFTEVTAAALGGNESFRAQLAPGHDVWLARLDSAFLPDTMALHGVATGDVDGDGFDDLYVSQPSGLPNRLFRNCGDGTFEDVTAGSGLDVLDGTSQSLIADVDNDGDQDVTLVVGSGLLLFLNDGKGRFTRDAEAFRYQGALRGSPTAAAMGDYDRDGFLDIYLCTYSFFIGAREDRAGPATPYHDAQNGPPNVLLRNDGRGRFVDVTDEVGLNENNDRFTFAAAWGDFDGDGWLDLLVANDFGRKNLYHNSGRAHGALRFKDVAATAGVENHGAGTSATWLDYDRDGDLDIYTGNRWTAAGLRVTAHRAFMAGAPEEVRALYRRHARGNHLFRNNGDGTFQDVTAETRTHMGRWAWSSDTIDFDLDGWEDLYVVNGMFTRDTGKVEDLDSFFWRQVAARSPLAYRAGTAYDQGWRAINRLLISHGSEAPRERKVLLRNDGRGGFDEISGTAGLDLDEDGRSFAVLDYDRDGDPDVVTLSPRASPQLRVFRNDRPSRHTSLAVRLRGATSNRDAIGARVTVETAEGRALKSLAGGSGFLSQHSKELLFGLGKSDRVAKLTVRWPSGVEQVFADIAANQRVTLEEGQATFAAERLSEAPAAPAVTTSVASTPVAPPVSTWLYEPHAVPDFTLADLAGRKVSLSALRGRPALLLLWATWAPPSRAALAELSRQRPSLAAAGVEVVALSVDEAGAADDVRAAASTARMSVVHADEETAGAYAVLSRFVFARREPLRLPTAFLLNEKGEIVKVYRDALDATEVLADVPRIAAPPGERLTRALPFAGTFYSMPDLRNDFPYALDLAEQGFEEAALAAFEQAAVREPNAVTFFNLATLYTKRRRPVEGRGALEKALALKPDYAEANNSLGALLAQGGDLAGGVARFRTALQSKPEFPDALNNLGFALFQTGQEKQAYELYEKALALQPDFPEAFNNLGIFHGQQGDLEGAASYFRQALSRRPEYGEASNNLALVLMAQQDAPEAIRTLEVLLEKDPGFDMGYVTLAKIHLTLGRPQDAAQVLEQLLQRNPSHPIGVQMMQQLRGPAR